MSHQNPTFFEALCDRVLAIRILFGVSFMFFILSLALVFFYEWGSAESVVTVLNLVGSAVFASASYYAVRKCREVNALSTDGLDTADDDND